MKKTDEYAKYNRLLRRLKVTPEQIHALPQITPYLTRHLKLPRDRVLELLRMSSEPEVSQWLAAYDSSLIPEEARGTFTYEFYCAVANLSPLRLLELLAAQIVRSGAQHSAIKAALRHPEVVEATITSALVPGPDGRADRDTLHKAVGFLPTPKGAQTVINLQANAQAGAAVAAIAAPPPELTIKSLVDRFNDARGQTAPPLLEAENDHGEQLPADFGQEESEPEMVPVMSPAQRLARRMYEEDKSAAED